MLICKFLAQNGIASVQLLVEMSGIKICMRRSKKLDFNNQKTSTLFYDELTEVEVLRKKVKQKSKYNQRSIQTSTQASSNYNATWRLLFNYANYFRLNLLSSSDGVLLYFV
ncbi:hypothetical protein T4D_9200 [Trichinella pseudospiralis]|uniref:Uncharacterized protein n=1 Tax=Trichinella pseudospiralis TaxID=6337 RepID=A0A0V1F769_TRIPS|nr:hypothetical protein T4D_9200 [Trichinella pseudospiralis]